jgi:hypothetical protein
LVPCPHIQFALDASCLVRTILIHGMIGKDHDEASSAEEYGSERAANGAGNHLLVCLDHCDVRLFNQSRRMKGQMVRLRYVTDGCVDVWILIGGWVVGRMYGWTDG